MSDISDKEQFEITVGRLLDELSWFSRDAKIQFSGGMEFHRVKSRGEKLAHIEFNQLVYQDKEGEWVVE